MRLGQLSRKISIRQSDVVDFLSKSGVSIANDSNARLEDEHVKSIIRHFAPSFLEENIPESEPISLEVAPEPVLTLVADEGNESPQEDSFDQVGPPESIAEVEEKAEVIKAAKIDLPGLKVLGKIELPEPKKKEVGQVENGEEIAAVPEQTETNKPRAPRSQNTQNNRQGNKRERPSRSSVNTIALQRERDARAAEEKRRLDAIKDKENRTEYYLKRVKASAPTKAARIYSEPVEQLVVAEKEKPKTWLGKFFRWLTTA